MKHRQARTLRSAFRAAGLALASVMLLAPAAPGDEPAGAGAAGVVERRGESLPSDIVCVNDSGRTVMLGDLLDRPAVLSLVYYSCEHICPQVMAGLARLASDLGPAAAKDFRIITFSFDPADKPGDAAVARKNYTLPLGPGFPEGSWAFLTAGGPEIRRLTSALGFSFVQEEHGFTHPVILVILSPGGRISRYVRVAKFSYGVAYPVSFPALETGELLRAAGRGVVAAGPDTPLLFCFPHEPPGLVSYFSVMTILGSITLVSLLALFIYLLAAGRGRTTEER